MIKEFIPVVDGVLSLVKEWEPILFNLSSEVITEKKNEQDRTIKQVIGHMVDSASNNIHRIVHLQNLGSPLQFPNYAIQGNNDRWITIQAYQNEDWKDLVCHWKYSNLHIVHVIKNVDPSNLDNFWDASDEEFVSLKEMILDYLRHLELHLNEIDEMIN